MSNQNNQVKNDLESSKQMLVSQQINLSEFESEFRRQSNVKTNQQKIDFLRSITRKLQRAKERVALDI
jgi:hypothetical protein